MQINRFVRCTLACLLVAPAISLVTRSQEKTAQSSAPAADSSKYANTTVGLRHLLQAMLEAAKSDDSQKLATLLKETEIPNCGVWLHTMYESKSADSWMGLCDAAKLESSEKSIAEQFSNFAREDGEIFTRKVNDSPEPNESGMLQSLRHPLDIYYASWRAPARAKPDPIGYFMFIDGEFRWESDIRFDVKTTIGDAKIVLPKLVKRVDPMYPTDAQGIHGTVRVQFRVGADGMVRDVLAVSGKGLSDDPRLRKAAEDAVKQWRYIPGTVDGRPAGLSGLTADFTFGT